MGYALQFGQIAHKQYIIMMMMINTYIKKNIKETQTGKLKSGERERLLRTFAGVVTCS